jgi:hypothetical protein
MSTTSRTVPTSVPKRTARPTQPLVFKMRAEFRRSAVYGEIGLVLIVAVCCVIVYFFPAGSRRPAVPVVLLLALAPVAVLRWRLRVDASGIARRRFFRWDLWPWEAFEQGKVLDCEGESTSYVLPEKPFWARKLTLGLLEVPDCERVQAIIDGLWTRPTIELPAELALRFGFRKEALIAQEGLLLRDGGEELRYTWKEAQALRIRRHDRRRRDFESLEILLPDRVVRFSLRRDNGQLIRSWSTTGEEPTPTAATLAGVLTRLVPPECVHITSLNDAPLTALEWQDRCSILAKKRRELTVLRWIIWMGSAAMLLLSLSNYPRGIASVIGMMVMSAIILGLLVIVVRRVERDLRDESVSLAAQRPEH